MFDLFATEWTNHEEKSFLDARKRGKKISVLISWYANLPSERMMANEKDQLHEARGLF